MGFLRVSNPSTTLAVALDDLGISIAANVVNQDLSDQFNVDDLAISQALIGAVVAGTLTAQVNINGTWVSVTPATFGSTDIYSASENMYDIAKTVNNSELVKAANTGLHLHDNRYYQKSELGSTSNAAPGAGLIGLDTTVLPKFSALSPKTLQAFALAVDNAFTNLVNLDAAYTNDADGILFVNGSSKPLNFQSNNVNDIVVSRKSGSDIQDALRLNVAANEMVIGALAAGALGQLNVRVKTNLIIEGDLTYSGKITDTTVNNMNVTNQRITLSDGAVAAMDAYIAVDRASSADAVLHWNETTQRWMAGIEGADETIALLEADETIIGTWKFGGGAAANSALMLARKAAAPTAKLGGASDAPVDMIGEFLCVYDKTNSRNKWLSVAREHMIFTGRDSATNSNEYARLNDFTANQSGSRLLRNATLVGIAVNTKGAKTWTAYVRKNGVVTNLAQIAITSLSGGQDTTLNVDFNAGDSVEIYISGTGVDRPTIKLEFANRF